MEKLQLPTIVVTAIVITVAVYLMYKGFQLF